MVSVSLSLSQAGRADSENAALAASNRKLTYDAQEAAAAAAAAALGKAAAEHKAQAAASAALADRSALLTLQGELEETQRQLQKKEAIADEANVDLYAMMQKLDEMEVRVCTACVSAARPPPPPRGPALGVGPQALGLESDTLT